MAAAAVAAVAAAATVASSSPSSSSLPPSASASASASAVTNNGQNSANMYRIGDYVYFENSSSSCFAIRRIEELTKTATGNVEARVMCFYRRSELPPSLQLQVGSIKLCAFFATILMTILFDFRLTVITGATL